MTLLQEIEVWWANSQMHACRRVGRATLGERSRPRAGAHEGTTTRPCSAVPCYGEIIRATIRKTTMTYKR